MTPAVGPPGSGACWQEPGVGSRNASDAANAVTNQRCRNNMGSLPVSGWGGDLRSRPKGVECIEAEGLGVR
jgi:hypothetical protein